MFRNPTELLLFAVLLLFTSFSCSGGASDDDGEPHFEPGDYDSTSQDGIEDDIESDSDSALPDCAEVCYDYCTLNKNCLTEFDQQQDYQCRESCRAIVSSGVWDSVISCAAAGENSGCGSLKKCLIDGGIEGWRCNPGQGGGDADSPNDGDSENSENVSCRIENDCEGGTHCDIENGVCRTACNPYWPQCPEGESCRVITEGTLAGTGTGMCMPTWSGAGEGEICMNSSDCAPGLLCGYTAQCERICDPGNDENICDYRLNCTQSGQYGVGTCAFCIGDEQCSGELVCENGYCVEEWECRQSQDCGVSGQGCFHGKCENGCTSDNDCLPGGFCDIASAYCYGNDCAEDCASSGLCCNRHECGPCCVEQCGETETCAYDSRCYPDLFCCVEAPDCREKPEAYCGINPCSRDNGACGGACPVTCSWGYGCGLWSGFDCRPLKPEACSMVGMNCEGAFACMMCNGETLGESGQCVATEDCPISKLDEEMSCYNDPLFSLECQNGHTCCLGEDGYYICCPQEKCVPGRGCVEPGYIPPAPYMCPECDRFSGDWTIASEEGDCPEKWQSLVIRRDEEYDCFFVVYHDSAVWANRIVDIMNCDSQVLLFDGPNGGYSECVLFLDGISESLEYHCKSEDVSCRIAYIKE